MRRFVLSSFIFVVAEELVTLASNAKRTSTRLTRGLLSHRAYYDRARLIPVFSPISFLSTVFFLRLRQRRSCRQQFPGGRRKLRERAASSRRIATFLFSIYVDFRAIPILGSVGCECIVHARILLGGYTVYLRALYRGYVLFRVELRN